MFSNLSLFRGASTLAALALACPVGSLAAQAGCPPAATSGVAAGWRAYRGDSLDLAADRFAPGVRCGLDAAVIGLGFVELRRGRLEAADSLFGAVVRRDSSQVDAWEGMARVAWRRGDAEATAAAAAIALRLAPDRADIRDLLERAAPDWDRPPLPPRRRPQALQLHSRIAGSGFEVMDGMGRWAPFYLQGVNLGVALPGRFPSEFPADSSLYAGWLDTLAAMNANVVRLYTILPPSFYRALRGHNLRRPDRPLWLVHGVWTELPPDHDFDDPAWAAEFRSEMRRVVDLVHGSVRIAPRAGHASGRYDADVSRWTLGYIIGREWEPYAVKAYDGRHPGLAPYRGMFLQTSDAPAMDRWLAEQCDYMLAYESDQWNALRPIAYTNWPTLDPLHHPTEADAGEEAAWRRRAGREVKGTRLEYENDAIGLDANLVRPTARNPAGWFASYHAYPYYPDFMLYDPGYLAARSSEGTSTYFGYLTDLRKHHAGVPFVISEYGVPSSRGNAHLQPQGWDHGGHDELEMAAIDARLTREIRESGAAGAIIFAWTDEWFKRNWIVIDFEEPGDRNRLWLNAMDAEQNYGILGQYAGDPATRPVLGGDPARWRALGAVQAGAGPLRALHVGMDEAYVYIALEVLPSGVRWDSLALDLAIDTFDPTAGQLVLAGGQLRSEIGFEFLLQLRGADSGRLLVLPAYNPYVGEAAIIDGDDFGRFYRRPVTTGRETDGRFDPMFVITNRARFGRDGTLFSARGYDRGRLRFGAEAGSTLADWYVDRDAGLIELRLPWGLLNVTDPSSRTVLMDRDGGRGGAFGTAVTGGFRFGAILYDPGTGQTPVHALPGMTEGRWRANTFRTWTWDTWEHPTSHSRLKPVYDSLQATWGGP